MAYIIIIVECAISSNLISIKQLIVILTSLFFYSNMQLSDIVLLLVIIVNFLVVRRTKCPS